MQFLFTFHWPKKPYGHTQHPRWWEVQSNQMVQRGRNGLFMNIPNDHSIPILFLFYKFPVWLYPRPWHMAPFMRMTLASMSPSQTYSNTIWTTVYSTFLPGYLKAFHTQHKKSNSGKSWNAVQPCGVIITILLSFSHKRYVIHSPSLTLTITNKSSNTVNSTHEISLHPHWCHQYQWPSSSLRMAFLCSSCLQTWLPWHWDQSYLTKMEMDSQEQGLPFYTLLTSSA